jgi:protein-tyrosine phosphatase
MAEHLLRRRLGGNSEWKVSSAGTSALGGSPASAGAMTAMEDIGIDISNHRSSRLTREMIDEADLIVVMGGAHRDQVVRMSQAAADKVFLLKSFGAGAPKADVEDPVGLSDDVYRQIRDEIDAELPDLVLFLAEYGEGMKT